MINSWTYEFLVNKFISRMFHTFYHFRDTQYSWREAVNFVVLLLLESKNMSCFSAEEFVELIFYSRPHKCSYKHKCTCKRKHIYTLIWLNESYVWLQLFFIKWKSRNVNTFVTESQLKWNFWLLTQCSNPNGDFTKPWRIYKMLIILGKCVYSACICVYAGGQ